MSKVKKYEDVELPLQQGKGKELPFESKEFIKRNDEKPIHNSEDIIEVLKVIQAHLKAIENNTFKGY